MDIYHMGIPGGGYGFNAYAADALQWPGKMETEPQILKDDTPGTVMTEGELKRWIDHEIGRNRERKKAQEDMTADSRAAWNDMRYRLTGGNGMRTEAPDQNGDSEIVFSDGKAVSDDGQTETPVSEAQIALLFEDGESFGAGKTAREYWEQSFEKIAKDAPESVKEAWIDAAEAAGVDGMGVSGSGKLSHITQMMVRRCTGLLRGENVSDMLGNSVQSARNAAEQALYDLEHPPEPRRAVSRQKMENMAKEKNFYQEFLKRLQGL